MGFARFEEDNSHRLAAVCSSGCECNMCTMEKNTVSVLNWKMETREVVVMLMLLCLSVKAF